ncbi:MAG: TRZ/ATZ family hydrolase [Burkholderiaceae bacterium]|nr:TRZ/ATZ family hydrolase [Burkholderiaceae bacterium]
MHVDTLIRCRWAIPMHPKNTVLENVAIGVADGNISVICDQNQAQELTADEIIELNDHVVIPGLVNAHSHAPMNILRGMGADLSLMDWLQTKIWPAEGKLMSPEFAYEGAKLAAQEMLLSGITCTNDQYFFSEHIARAFEDCAMKCTVSALVIGFPSAMAQTTDDYFKCADALFERYQGNNHVRISVGPHAPYTVDDNALSRVVRLSERHNAPIHMHIDETDFEVQESLRLYGMRPIERLANLGIINERLISVHTVHPNDHEMALLANAGAHVAHCPSSNLKLASGFSPVHKMMQMGINVAIGTDSVASNDKLDILAETRLAAMLGKAVAMDPTAMKVHDMLYAATLGGARAIGWGDRIGSIEIGKAADLVAIHLADINTIPTTDPATQLLYSADRSQISHVWTDGKCVVSTQLLQNSPYFHRESSVKLAKKWQNAL